MTEKILKLLQGHLKIKHKFDYIYDYQIEIARTIIDALIQNLRLTKGATEEDIKRLKHIEHAFEISRQAGKTTIVVGVIEFIMIYLTEMFGRPINIGIFAPQKEQAKTDFDRLKSMLRKDTDFTEEQHLVKDDEESELYGSDIDRAKEESNARTIVLPNGSSCYIFPVTSTSKPESKTLDLIIFEEGQDLDDNIVKQQIEPMTSATNGPHVYVGTAGTQICKFYRLGQTERSTKIYYPQIVKQRRQAYEKTGNVQHLIYEQTINQRIEEYGLDSDEIQRPYFGKWLIGSGQFVTQEDLEKLESERKETYHEKIHNVFVGIDTAKQPDSTVATALRFNPDTNKKEVIAWLELMGDNYQNQFDVIREWLKNYKVQAIAIDSTGQGDFMPDMFEAHTQWADEYSGLYRVKFSAVSKDNLYKNLKVSIKEFLTTLPMLSTKRGVKFKQQMLDLQQEYKGQLLSVHHPDVNDAHDDYADSWALAEWAYAKWQETKAEVKFVEIVNPDERKVSRDDSGKVTDYWPGD